MYVGEHYPTDNIKIYYIMRCIQRVAHSMLIIVARYITLIALLQWFATSFTMHDYDVDFLLCIELAIATS